MLGAFQIDDRDLAAHVLVTFPAAHRIVLFGAHPRDDTHAKRELDLLVVTPTRLRPRVRSALLRKGLQVLSANFKLIVVTPEEFERLRAVPDGVVARALKEGLTLHEDGSSLAGGARDV